MIARHADRLLWVGTAALLALAIVRWRAAVPAVAPPGLGIPVLRVVHAADTLEALDAAADHVFEHDPFRLVRHASPVAFGVEPAAFGGPPPPPAPPKPALVLKGVVGGPPWRAVLDGVPGREASVLVAKGDTVGGIRVRAVGRDTVVLQGMDTTWRLTVRRVWQE